MRKGTLTSSVLLALGLSGTSLRAAAATPVELALERRMSTGFVETPFERAIDYIRKQTRVNIVIDRKIVGAKALATPVTFQVEDVPTGEALEWLGKLAGLDYEFRDEEIVVSTLREIMRKRVVLKTYDIKTLARMFSQFPGPDLVQTPREFDMAGGGPIALAEAERPLASAAVADLIRESIRPTEWAPEMGTSIEERNATLVVVHTPEVHAEIEALLAKFNRAMNKMVSFHVAALKLPSVVVDEALENCHPDGALTEKGLRLVDPSAAAGNGRLLASTRFTCFNNQRVHSYGGKQGTYVSDYDATGTIYDPVISLISEGLLVDVRPVITGDGRHVMMSLKLEYAARMPEGAFEFHAFGPEDPGSDEGRSELKDTRAPTPGAVQLQRTAMTSLRTSIRPRSGGTFLFSASSPETGLPYDGNELVFLVKATPVSF